jgi:hypothetical protein
MSRVTRSTLRSAAVGVFAVAAVSLSACGSDDPSTATPATTPMVVDTTPEKTPKPKLTPKPKAAVIPAVIKSDVAVTPEGQKAIDAASERAIGQAVVDAKVLKIMKALDKAGFKNVRRSAGSAGGPIVIQGGTATTVMVYPNEKMGARQAAGFTIVLTNSKAHARLARDGNVVVAVNAPKGLTSKLRKEFDDARKIAFNI